MYAGARSIIACPWEADGAATEHRVVSFHRNLEWHDTREASWAPRIETRSSDATGRATSDNDVVVLLTHRLRLMRR